jgi:hypothetical protein
MPVTPSRSSTPNRRFRDNGFLYVDDGAFFKGPSSLRFDLLVNTDKLDIGLIRSWINICRRIHKATCGSIRQTSRQMVDFKVIDCEGRSLVSPPEGCQYVALSYVWGSLKCLTEGGRLQTNFPQTIQDAIILTQQLGYKYLWVDRYCISQDKSEKHAQIQQMDLIYSGAELTIIAAVGSDPSYGLPGVSRPRLTRYQAGAFMPNFLDALTMVRASKWWTRAWTYQEAILSKRNLVITDYQAYFECSHLQFYEAVDSPPCKLITGMQYGTCTCCHSTLFTMADIYPSSLGAWGLIVDYTNRHLTHQEDILDGISGIFREFQERHEPFYFHWGIPISGRPSASGRRASRAIDIPGRFATALCWRHDEPEDRRPGFPSWTWAGWFGPVSGWMGRVDFQGFLPVMVHAIAEAPIAFKVEDELGHRKDIVDYLVSYKASGIIPPNSSILHINASIISLSLHTTSALDNGRSVKSPQEVWAKCAISSDHYIWVPVNITARSLRNLDRYHWQFCGVILGSISKDVVGTFPPTAVMVIRCMGNIFERVGFIVLSYPLQFWRHDRGPVGRFKTQFGNRESFWHVISSSTGRFRTGILNQEADGLIYDVNGIQKTQRDIRIG